MTSTLRALFYLVANALWLVLLFPIACLTMLVTWNTDNSLVLAVEYGPTHVLLMSDAGESAERRLLASGGDLRAQLIVKGRHGREPSCTDAFLDAVRPEAVVVAAALRPIDRYPDPELRERLQPRGVRLIRTDEAGAVTIRLTKRGYTLSTFLH